MADNIYLLETRLSPAQQSALEAVRMVARQQGLTVFLVGGAVRDLMSGSPVRDLDVVVQGDARDLRSALEGAGGVYSGQSDRLQSLYVRFQGGVRVEVGSTLSVTYPKPAEPVFEAATILDDLRRRDFTANAMALSLNEGSYGLLMDPLNGVADIENRELRLVSNYGFIEDPARLIRAARFMARLGWQMDERTRARYDTAKEEGYIATLKPEDRGYEVEELFYEEEPLRVMRRLEDEGWLKHLSPLLSVAKANAPELTRLREAQMQLETRGIRADAAAANFPLLTGKISTDDLAALKKSFPQTAFVHEIDTLDASAKELGSQLLSKAMAAPSEAYKLILRTHPVTVLWTVHTSRSAALQARVKSFLTEWPQAQSKLPTLLMNEMRIVPELPGYADLQETLFYALMDGKLTTPEEMRAFLEPYSPPAPPPPVSLRRPRAPKKEGKAPKSRKKVAVEADSQLAADSSESLAASLAEDAAAATSLPTPASVEPPVAPPAMRVAPSPPAKNPPAPASQKTKAAAKAQPVTEAVARPAEETKPAAGKAASSRPSAPPAKAASATKTVEAAKKASSSVPAKAAKPMPVAVKGKSSRKAAEKQPVKKVVAKGSKAAPPAKSPAKKAAPAKQAKAPAKKVIVPAAKKAVAKPLAPKKGAAKRPVAGKKKTPPAKKAVAKRR